MNMNTYQRNAQRTSSVHGTDRNIEKLVKRYPDGFNPENSIHRKGDCHV